MNIFDLFTPKAETYYLTESMSVRQALETFDKHKFSIVPIISDNGLYISTLSQGDVLRYIKYEGNYDVNHLEHVNIMQLKRYRPYEACKHTMDMNEVIRLGLQQSFIPIIDDRNIYIGIIKRKSILQYMYEKYMPDIQ